MTNSTLCRVSPANTNVSSSDLQRRGCPRAAFEHARLLFSLQPLSDPHGALLHLDFLSVKAGMGDWLEEVWKVYHDIEEGEDYTDPSILPGWAYARALILRGKEKTKRDRGEVGCASDTKDFPLILASGYR